MSDATSPSDPDVAARLVALEAMVATARAELDVERARRTNVEAERDQLSSDRDRVASERDQLREAYEALKIQVELARRRLTIAKAERIDTEQLELEFAATLAKLDKLAEQRRQTRRAGSRTRARAAPCRAARPSRSQAVGGQAPPAA